MKNVWKEFKEFAIKGNAIDLAIGVMTIPAKARRCPHCTSDLGETA